MGRRTYGEGTVYERRPGRWRAQVRLGPGVRFTADGGTPAEARQRLAAKVDAHARGVAAPGRSDRVGEFLTAWVEECHGAVKAGTWRQRDSIVRRHLLPYLGHLRLAELRADDLIQLYNGLRTGRLKRPSPPRVGRPPSPTLSETSLHHIHATVRLALDDAVARGLVERNVARIVRRPPTAQPRDKVILAPEQASTLLTVVRGRPLEALVTLALTTGMREGELLGLRWAAIDWADAKLTVETNAQRGYDGRLELTQPKTRASTGRILRLSALAVAALRQHRAGQGQVSLLAFPTPGGNLMQATTLRREFSRMLEDAGLQSMAFHHLRHTYATLAILAGVPVEEVSYNLGHASPAITWRVYYHHVQQLRQHAAAAAMDRLFAGG
jgi:integrase